MTRTQLIQWARDAGGVPTPYPDRRPLFLMDAEILEAFASLVAAAEREACAKVCDEVGLFHEVKEGADLAQELAAAIRARGAA